MIIIQRLLGLDLKIIKPVHDLILALVEVLNLILFGLSDSLFETLSQFVEVIIDCFEVLIELIYQLLCVIGDCIPNRAFDLFCHFLEKNLDMRALRLVDELILDLYDRVNHFCDSLLL